MADRTEAEVVAELARDAMEPLEVHGGQRYAILDSEGEYKILDTRADLPVFKTGSVTVRDVAAFAEYYRRHADDDTEVFVDLDAGKVIAILDAHRTDGARWQNHRLVLQLVKTPQWVTWTGQDRKPQPQREFAEFLEDNRADLDPQGTIAAADFLELAQSFHATTSLEFSSANRLSSSAIELVYKETGEASAGRGTKRIEIPTEFTLAIKPFDDCPAMTVNARFRWRAREQQVTFTYVLDNPTLIVQQAVKDIVERLRIELDGKPIMRGEPAGPSH